MGMTNVIDNTAGVSKAIPYPEAKQSSVSSLSVGLTSVSATITLDKSMNTILVDATAAARVVTLPDATKVKGLQYTIKKIGTGTNTVTITPYGTQKIDTAATLAISAALGSYTLVSDGSNWQIVAKV
jgi:hypothetical protein